MTTVMSAESTSHGSDIEYRKPRVRQRIHKEPPSLAVPDINEDALERKRVLNVLAQRRYRQRKKRSKGRVAYEDVGSDTLQLRSRPNNEEPSSGKLGENPPAGITSGNTGTAYNAFDNLSITEPITLDIGSSLDLGLSSSWPTESLESILSDLSSSTEEHNAPGASPFSFQFPSALIDPTNLAKQPSSTPSDPDSASPLSFPDTYLLPVNELTLLRGFLRIADRLHCRSSIWDLNATSPFLDGTHTASSLRCLPAAWRPTPSQATTPHHPVIDILPWPSVRERLLLILSLPEAARPPGAEGPLALVRFVYDLEDGAEGARIWGSDPCEPGAWEVGQKLFERWWFVFDRQIIDRSNYWREMRGAAALRM
ncbi:hypothetical protein F4810DRAFT_375036 [Camillea tinctor]|nr:hypothetical protein F4810DRAFT_375036 [Camillea tinctor]